jgi:hypothetical protein
MNIHDEVAELVGECEMELQAIRHGLPGSTVYLSASTLLLLHRVRRRLSRQVERLENAKKAVRQGGLTTRQVVEEAEGKKGLRHFTGK